jgi:mycothiol synthase
MTRADLETVMAEPWFDAEDFLVLEAGGAPGGTGVARDAPAGEIIGYSWMKVARTGGTAEPEGEFYVVGVSPDRRGEGWGRVLVEAGFARLASRGIRTAHLYVEGDNTAALALYRAYGFAERSRDIQYRWQGSAS